MIEWNVQRVKVFFSDLEIGRRKKKEFYFHRGKLKKKKKKL